MHPARQRKSTSTVPSGARSGSARRRRGVLARAALACVLLASLASVAVASGSRPTVSAASNATIRHTILVNAQGRTLYVLTPETSRHLLCTSAACLAAWPPLTVPSRSTKLVEGAGVHGTLGLLKRKGGALQVTLNGLPLYLFVGDSARGQATGQDLVSFGGTWHVVFSSGRPS